MLYIYIGLGLNMLTCEYVIYTYMYIHICIYTYIYVYTHQNQFARLSDVFLVFLMVPCRDPTFLSCSCNLLWLSHVCKRFHVLASLLFQLVFVSFVRVHISLVTGLGISTCLCMRALNFLSDVFSLAGSACPVLACTSLLFLNFSPPSVQ